MTGLKIVTTTVVVSGSSKVSMQRMQPSASWRRDSRFLVCACRNYFMSERANCERPFSLNQLNFQHIQTCWTRAIRKDVCSTASQPESRVKSILHPTISTKYITDSLQRRGEALKVNINAGEGLQDVLKSNLGPLGTIKMYAVLLLVSGIKLTNPRLVDGAGGVYNLGKFDLRLELTFWC